MATIPPQKGKKQSPSPRVVDVVDPRRRCLELVEKVAKAKDHESRQGVEG